MINLPIDSHLARLSELVDQQNGQFKPLVLTASPGSGKTTRLPAYLLKKNLQKDIRSQHKIIVIVPKRVSAISAADRIAEENNFILGNEVGYQVRFEQKLSEKTQLIFMTEGLFLKRIQDENFWADMHTLILDEFHERSANLDIILGLVYERLVLDPQFNLIVMSATLNTEALKKYFGSCEIYNLEAPPFKLMSFFSDKTQKLNIDEQFYNSLKETTLKAIKTAQKDILIFLPGLKEILRFKNLLQPLLPQMQIEILHGSVSLSEQKRIVQKYKTENTALNRRIILTTNIAESSVTVQGIDCVVDSGLQKNVFIEPKIGFTGLDIERISLFSAKQRAGRAAREQDGYCFKMWHEIDERSMKEQADPEILNSTLIEEFLILKQQKVDKIETFSWLTKPKAELSSKVLVQLRRWQLLSPAGQLSSQAQTIMSWPIDIINSLITYELIKQGYSDQAYKLATVLDSGKIDQILSADESPIDDLNKIINADLKRFNLDLNYQQIKRRCVIADHDQNKFVKLHQTFEEALIYTFTKYFPEKIAVRKKQGFGVSLFGRGIQFQNQSNLNDSEYFIIINGRESHQQSTQLICGLGFDKKTAQHYFMDFSQRKTEIHYDFEKHEFFKIEQLMYENIVLNDFGKVRLSNQEIDQNWKDYFLQNSKDFLSAHHQYEHLKIMINFVSKFNESYFKLDLESTNLLNQCDQLLTQLIADYYSSIQDFLQCDLLHLSYQVLNDDLSGILQQLPRSIKTPRGKIAQINYQDDKAPLISLKIQDAFGWNDTPKIYNNQIPLTLELLAPNMRPAQITNRLGQFWQTSYIDVRKDLRARYPKHDWPEDPRV